MQPLELRILQLEKQTRFYRFAFMILLLLAAAGLFMSFNNRQPAPDLLQAKKIQVVDDKGNVVVELKSSDFTGNGEINTMTPQKTRLVSLFTTEGGGGAINTFDEFNMPIFKLTQTAGGGGYMALMNEESSEIVEFGATDQSSGYMRINDRLGNRQAWITYTRGGGGYFSLFNNESETIRFSTAPTGGRLGMYNNKNVRIAFLGAQDNQDGNLTIFGREGGRSGGVPQ